MGPILALAKKKKLYVIEDCAQCLGGEYRGKKVGTLGDVGCFSFCQSKHITTLGEGGMVVCRSVRTARAVESLRDHGWKVASAPKEYERVGYNARLTEVQSAVGLCELARFETWQMPRRRRLTEELLKSLRALDAQLGEKSPFAIWPVDTPERKASFWLVPVVLKPSALSCSVAKLIESMQKSSLPAYRILWPLEKALPMASKLESATVGFWVHPTLKISDMRRIAASIRTFLI
jgi:dTDP-4-amino-4,6-dideoxygalactose transaminase